MSNDLVVGAAAPGKDSNARIKRYYDEIMVKAEFHQAIRQAAPPILPADRLKRTIWNAMQQNPDLFNCTLPSILKSSMTAAVLGLEVDNAIGQGFLLPFNDNKRGNKVCTFIAGYKGYITLAERASYVLDARIVREKDVFEYCETLDGPELRHIPHAGNLRDRGEITFAYSRARSRILPSMVVVMSKEELDHVRGMSPAVKFNKRDSAWFSSNPVVMETMFKKIPIRQLGSKMPMKPIQAAAALESEIEAGNPAYLSKDFSLVRDSSQQHDLLMTCDQPEALADGDPLGSDDTQQDELL